MESGHEQQRCRLCGTSGLLPVHSKPYGIIVRCAQCEVLLLNPPQGNDSCRQAQEEVFGDQWLEYRLALEQVTSREAHVRLREIQRYVSRGRLLEIGCGTGELLAVAGREGFEVTGVDSSPQVRAQARARFSLRELYASLDAVPASPGHFDVAVMSHVLEHIYEPVPLLRHVHSLLRPGGFLFLAVPNLDGWGSRLLGADWPGFAPHHLTYFNFKTLSHLLGRTGFSVVARCHYGPPTLAPSLLHFAKLKILRRKAPLPDITPGASLAQPQRLAMKGLHLSARLALEVLHLALYPLGLLEIYLGKKDGLPLLAQKVGDGEHNPASGQEHDAGGGARSGPGSATSRKPGS